ncbi:MAG: endo-1,4-beta-xylanase [Kineosporiaceae bacterium]
MTTHRRARRLAGALTALVLAAGGGALAGLVVVPAGAADLTLAEAGARSGRTIGVAVGSSVLTRDAAYAAIVDREFASVAPEVEFRFDSTQIARGTFWWVAIDRIVDWAAQHGKKVRGYPLMQGAAQAAWFVSLNPDQRRGEMVKHLDAVLGRYGHVVDTWDLVSEVYLDNGSLRPSAMQVTGSDWVELAYRTARAAAPDTRFCYSDYGIEDWASPKTQAVYAMVKDFKARGVPLDCVSLQSHFVQGLTHPASMPQTMAAFAALGVDVELSELDVTGDAKQAEVYAQVARECREQPRCTGITLFGVRDIDSWTSSQTPLLFDRDGARKPAYTAFRDALLGVPPTTTTVTPTTSPTTSKPTTTKPTTTKPKTTRTKKTTTVCRTRKNSQVTCKVVTRR